MAGIAALCLAIGLYPPLLYAFLPAPVSYAAFDPVQTATTLAILGAAALFFFTIGKRVLEPHETRLVDVDVAYTAGGHGIVVLARGMQAAFRAIYQSATTVAMGFFKAGRMVMEMEDRDVNWNTVAFGCAFIAMLAWVIVAVAS